MGTQSRVHSASRIKPTFIGEDGSQYQPRSLMDSSWTAGHSIAAGYGDGQVGPLYHVIGQADPGAAGALSAPSDRPARSGRSLLGGGLS